MFLSKSYYINTGKKGRQMKEEKGYEKLKKTELSKKII